MDKKTRDAFRIVFEELTRNPMFKGKYDAKNGNKHFMYGVSTVMENIAYNADEWLGENFSDTFFENMIKSEEKD